MEPHMPELQVMFFLLHTLMCTMNAPCGLGWVWSHLVTLLRIRRVSHWNGYLLFRLWLPCFDLPLAHTPQKPDPRSTIGNQVGHWTSQNIAFARLYRPWPTLNVVKNIVSLARSIANNKIKSGRKRKRYYQLFGLL